MAVTPLDIAPMTLGSLALTSIALGQFTAFEALGSIARVFAETADKAQEEKRTYSENLEKAEGEISSSTFF